MHVVAHGPQAWYLLKDEEQYLLDARCQQGPGEFSMLIPLDPREAREHHALGGVYLDYLAARISYWASEYRPRDVSNGLGDRAHKAIMEWRGEHPDA